MSELHAPLAKTGPKGKWVFIAADDDSRFAHVLAHNWFDARRQACALIGCPASEAVCVRNPTL